MIRNQKLISADQLGKEDKGQSNWLINSKSMINIVYTIIYHLVVNNSQHKETDLLHTIEKLLADTSKFTLLRATL